MITNGQIKDTIDDCLKSGHIVNVRDIMYAILCYHIEDPLVAYKSLFGNDADYCQEYLGTYDNTGSMSFLKTYVEMTLINSGKKKTKAETQDITFEENKAYMLNLKKQTEDAMAAGDIDKKDGLKILTDISTKLNDKFQVSSEEKSQVVQVFTKYNSICSRCGTELYIPTKEELMAKYNLIENNK